MRSLDGSRVGVVGEKLCVISNNCDEMLKPEGAKKLHLENNASQIYDRLPALSKAAMDRTVSSH